MLLRAAELQRNMIIREQALGLGASSSLLGRRVDSGAWQRLFKCAFVTHAGFIDWYTRAAGAAFAASGALAGRSAAHVWQVDSREKDLPPHIDVISKAKRRFKAPDVKVTRSKWLCPDDITLRGGTPVLQPLPLLIQLGDDEVIPRDEVEIAIDFFVRKNFVRWEQLEAASNSPKNRTRRGASMIRELLAIRAQRQHTDSMLETLGAQLLPNAGLPEPVLQYPIRISDDLTLHADLAYPKHNLLVETVGFGAHRSEVYQYVRDCRRSNAINLLQKRYVVLHYTWKQVTKTPNEIVEQVAPRLGFPVQECFRMLERPGGRPALYTPLR